MNQSPRPDRIAPAAGSGPYPEGNAPQPLVGYRSNEEWNTLLAQASAMIGALDEIDEASRGKIFTALEGIDAIHREALHRLVRLFKEGVLEQVITDPAIHTLMGMYDLLPEKEPGCAKVWNFMAPEEPASGVAAAAPEELPHWLPVPLDGRLADGATAMCMLDGRETLIARVRGEDFALAAVCPTHGAAMTGGTLSGYSWICPHGAGCVYDVRNGARLGGGDGLDCRPVKRDAQDRLLVGFGIPFKPSLPAF